MDFELKKNLIVLLILLIVVSVLFFTNLKNYSPDLFKYDTYKKFYSNLLNYFLNLSQGQVSLVSTFWLWNIFVPAFLIRFIIGTKNPILFSIFFIIYHTLALIFLGRSASKYLNANKNFRAVWGYLSYLYIILIIVAIVLNFIFLFQPSMRALIF